MYTKTEPVTFTSFCSKSSFGLVSKISRVVPLVRNQGEQPRVAGDAITKSV